jgi:hypothetical protein
VITSLCLDPQRRLRSTRSGGGEGRRGQGEASRLLTNRIVIIKRILQRHSSARPRESMGEVGAGRVLVAMARELEEEEEEQEVVESIAESGEGTVVLVSIGQCCLQRL